MQLRTVLRDDVLFHMSATSHVRQDLPGWLVRADGKPNNCSTLRGADAESDSFADVAAVPGADINAHTWMW